MDSVWTFLNSAFTTGFVGALAGAAAGAWAAQRIAERGAVKTRKIAEIRSINAALASTLSILNTYAAMKRQHIQPLREAWRNHRAEYDAALAAANAGEQMGLFVVKMDFATLDPQHVPIDQLETLLWEKAEPSLRALTLLSFLRQSIMDLNRGLELRNKLIEEIQNRPRTVRQEVVHIYLA